MAKSAPTSAPTSFEEQLRLALAHYHDPAWLAAESPLAAPYWAGQPPAGTGAGEWLRQVLYDGAASLWAGDLPDDRDAILAAVNEERAVQGKGNRYAFLILEMHYFQHHFRIPKQNFIWEDYLFIGKSQYYRDLDGAVRILGQRLLERLRPSFRPEQPRGPRPFVGRKGLIAESLSALGQGQRVSLSGASGMGKSAVGMTIAEQWCEGAAFWYSVRPGLTDQLQGLLLALGYFLHMQGSSGLWRQVIAGKGQLDSLHLALGLAHQDLAQLGSRRPLLCFDDLDRLHSTDFTGGAAAHEQILELLNGLQGHTPMLLIGQRATAEADVYLAVEGLTTPEIEGWLREADVSFDAGEAARLQAYTGGSPRFIRLCAALTRNGDSLTAVLDTLPSVPVLPTLFRRLWHGLSSEEQALVRQLSVFVNPAPIDAFAAHGRALERLETLNVTEQDDRSGVTLLPVIRDVVYPSLSTEEREQHHLDAAAVYVGRGQYTDAAYHFWQGGEATRAVELWFDRREIELLSGRAAQALTLFHELSARRLEPAIQEKLALIRSELHRFAGETTEALTTLEEQEWSTESDMAPEGMLLKGRLQQGVGRYAEALDTYDEGVAATTRLLRQRVALQVGRGIAYIRQKEVRAAWREATLARYEAEHMQGVVQEAMGDYSAAGAHFSAALRLAEDAGYEQGAARTHYHLAGLAGRQLESERAIHHLDHAIRHYESIGDLFTLECVRTNLAAVKIQVGAYADAIRIARDALQFFERVRHPYWTRLAATTLAEASYEAGLLDDAERAAQLVLNRAEPHHHAYVLVTMGHIHRQRGDIEAAIGCYQRAINTAAGNEDVYIEAYAWRGLALAYRETAQNELGRSASAKAIALFRQLRMEKEAEAVEAQIKIAG